MDIQASNTLAYLALGDSYTIGESIEPLQAYPYQLAEQLTPTIKVAKPQIIARTGWTTDELITAIKRAHIDKTYDLVTLLIGVNNQYRGYNEDIYRVEFIQLLHTSIAFAKGNKNYVFVLSIPDWGVTPYANGQDKIISPKIDRFNAINKEESTKAGVHYLDITPISRQAKTDLLLVADDGLHPSAAMYKLWVQELAPMVTVPYADA
ncbi:MAG TPA: SGNH/GDSL hydrolase family protein [Mucilaginibacter sp.]